MTEDNLTEEQKEKILKFYKEKIENNIEFNKDVEQWLKRREDIVKNYLEKEELKNLTESDLTKFLKELYASIRGRTNIIIVKKNDPETIKNRIYDLLYGDRDIKDRFNDFINLKYLSIAYASEILNLSFPEKFGVVNNSTIESLTKLGFENMQLHPADWDKYNSINNILIAIKDELNKELNKTGLKNFDLHSVDLFLYYLKDDNFSSGENEETGWWVESTRDKDHRIPGSNQYDLGKAIWCPQKWEDNKDRCKIRNQIKKEDKVLHIDLNKKTIIGVSIVENGYEEFEIPQGTKWSKNGPTKGFIIKLKEFKKVSNEINWEELKKDKEEELKKIPNNERFYDKDLKFKQGKYLNELSPDLLKIINEEYKKISNENLPYYTDEVPPKVSQEPPNKSTLDAIIEEKKQVILYGPPGTGKTYIAKKYIEYTTNKDEKRYRVITFHPSYSYEEFVEGIRPKVTKDHIRFEIEEGIFKKLCRDAYNAIIDAFNNSSKKEKLKEWEKNEDVPVAREDLSEALKEFIQNNTEDIPKYYLLIDEINRGDISKIFGELITLLEDDKRLFSDNEMVLKLPYSKTDFGVPPNLYIIGTMNTADRSIALLDVALRRRFGFIEIMPDSEQLKLNELDSKIMQGLKNDLGDSADLINFLKTLLENLNSKIAYNLDRDHQIGHAYFIKLTKINNYDEFIKKLKEIWFYEIIPLLQEYFYNNTDKLKEIIVHFMDTTDKNNENKAYKIKSISEFNNNADFIKELAKIGSNSGENTE